MSWDVIVVGGANSDFVARGDRLPRPGETQPGAVFLAGPGGKGANQAVAAARLGARVAFVGAVGEDDRGSALIGHLERQGVDVGAVVRRAASPTGAAVIHVDAHGEKQILAFEGANRLLEASYVGRALDRLGGARVVAVQLEVPLETVHAALRAARASGAATVLDPAPPSDLPDDLLRLVDVIKPNSSEAQALTGVRIQDPDSARRAARALIDRGVGAVIVQAGDVGNLLVSPEGEHLFPRIPVKAVDATGAGDALVGALAARLAEGRPLAAAAREACAAAAFATTAFGAQGALATDADLRRLLTRA